MGWMDVALSLSIYKPLKTSNSYHPLLHITNVAHIYVYIYDLVAAKEIKNAEKIFWGTEH